MRSPVSEHGDPDDVERVPEQREAQDAALGVRPKPLGGYLRHHRQEPQDAGIIGIG